MAVSWFDRIFNRSARPPVPEPDYTDFQDNFPGKTGEGAIPGSTTTSPPERAIPRRQIRNFQVDGDSGGAIEAATIDFQDAWQSGGPGHEFWSTIARRGVRERSYDPDVVAGNLNGAWTPSRTDTPIGHADYWTPQAQGAYLPREGTGHPLDPAGPGFTRPIPGLPRLSDGRRKIYLTGEVHDFGAAAVIDMLGIQPVTGAGRTRIRPKTWWEEPAPYFANYYLSGPTTGTPATPGREESPAQAQTAATGAGDRRASRIARRRTGG